MARTVTIEHGGVEHTYEVGDCACGRTSVRYYSEDRCFFCTHHPEGRSSYPLR